MQQISWTALKRNHRAPLYAEAENQIICCSSKAFLSSKKSMCALYGRESMKEGLLHTCRKLHYRMKQFCGAFNKKLCVHMTKKNESCYRKFMTHTFKSGYKCISVRGAFWVRRPTKLGRFPGWLNKVFIRKRIEARLLPFINEALGLNFNSLCKRTTVVWSASMYCFINTVYWY